MGRGQSGGMRGCGVGGGAGQQASRAAAAAPCGAQGCMELGQRRAGCALPARQHPPPGSSKTTSTRQKRAAPTSTWLTCASRACMSGAAAAGPPAHDPNCRSAWSRQRCSCGAPPGPLHLMPMSLSNGCCRVATTPANSEPRRATSPLRERGREGGAGSGEGGIGGGQGPRVQPPRGLGKQARGGGLAARGSSRSVPARQGSAPVGCAADRHLARQLLLQAGGRLHPARLLAVSIGHEAQRHPQRGNQQFE